MRAGVGAGNLKDLDFTPGKASMPKQPPSAALEHYAAELQRDLAYFEAQLAKIPVDSNVPDDRTAREIFERLIWERWSELAALR
jgi:hypothetical protein